jgi:hypothetical protein
MFAMIFGAVNLTRMKKYEWLYSDVMLLSQMDDFADDPIPLVNQTMRFFKEAVGGDAFDILKNYTGPVGNVIKGGEPIRSLFEE